MKTVNFIIDKGSVKKSVETSLSFIQTTFKTWSIQLADNQKAQQKQKYINIFVEYIRVMDTIVIFFYL